MATTTFKTNENNASGTLSAAIVAGDVTCDLQAGEGAEFPSSGTFWVTLFGSSVDANEIALCTSRSTDELTITRAQQGTSALDWPENTNVQRLWTKGDVDDTQDAINNIEDGSTTLATVTTTVDATVGGQVIAGSGTHTLTNAAGLIDGVKIQNGTVDDDSLDATDDYAFNSVAVGGGYGSTGSTLSAAGVGQFNGALTTDGALTADGDLQYFNSSGTFNTTTITAYRESAYAHGVLYFQAGRGTLASPAAMANNDNISDIAFRLYDGSAFREAASIRCDVDGTVTDGVSAPGRIEFLTTPDGSITPAIAMTIGNAGDIETPLIHNNGGTGATGALASGTYTPTIGTASNVASSTAREHSWSRVGQVVIVQGAWDITPTAGATYTYYRFNIPVASALVNAWELTGGGSVNEGTTAILPVIVVGYPAEDNGLIGFISNSTNAHSLRYSFQYQVI